MQPQMTDAIATLEDILVREQALLLAGRARETADLVKDKVAALQVFDEVVLKPDGNALAGEDRKRVEAIIAIAKENAVHFTSVRNGIRGALGRIESLTDGAYVGAYSAGGGRTAFPKAAGSYVNKV